MEDLRIVRGNDFYLRVPVERVVFKDVQDSQSIPPDRTKGYEGMPLSYCSILGVNLIGDDLDKPVRLQFTINENGAPSSATEHSDTEEHIIEHDPPQSEVVVKVKGNLECGWYGLEVVGTYDGRDFRSYERKVFKIVENNGKSNVGNGEWYDNEPSYQIDTMYTLYAQASYPLFALDTETMCLYQYGVVENGEMGLDEYGNLIMEVNETFSASSNDVSNLQPATPVIEQQEEQEEQEEQGKD